MYPDLLTIPGIGWTVPTFGFVMMLAFLLAIWWTCRRCSRVKVDSDMALNVALIGIFSGLAGARGFYVIHYWQEHFARNPAAIFSTCGGGMELYGGVLTAFLCCSIYLWFKGVSLRLFSDLVTPGLLAAMGIGRLGCFCLGCCWGSLCPPDLPWAVRFPYGSPAHQRHWENRLVSVPAEFIFIDPAGRGNLLPRPLLRLTRQQLEASVEELNGALEAARQSGDPRRIARAEARYARARREWFPVIRHFEEFATSPEALARRASDESLDSLPVHPSQLYGAVGPLLLSLVTSSYFYRRRRHGTVLVLGAMLYALERFIEEAIRADNPRDSLGMTVSQAISLGIFTAAGAWYLVLRRLPDRSPVAEPRRISPTGDAGDVAGEEGRER